MRDTWWFGLLACSVLCLPLSVSAETGRAAVMGTSEDSPSLFGELQFEDTPEGLSIDGRLAQVPPGLHGFHIHAFGSCDEGGTAAGGHYNPSGAAHGDIIAHGVDGAHAGDLGNIEIQPDGTGELHLIVPELSLSSGPFTVGGRAVILHELPDDFGQPTGNAGGRIGCGTIILTGP